jgi:tetratricopeptide (TPR) repeat protein
MRYLLAFLAFMPLALGLSCKSHGAAPTEPDARERGARAFHRGHYQSALSSWREWEIDSRAGGDAEATAESQCLQSMALQALGQLDDSVAAAKRCLSELERMGAPHADAFTRLLDALMAAGSREEARVQLERHVQAMKAGTVHPDCDLLFLIYQLAGLSDSLGRPRDAEALYLEGIRSLEAAHEVDRGQLVNFLDAIGGLYARLGQRQRAADLCHRRQDLYLEIDGPSMVTVEVFEGCADTYRSVGRLREASASLAEAERLRRDLGRGSVLSPQVDLPE